jgi:hypothetical protein
MEIAKTIQSQLLGLGRIKVMCWGANSWTGGKDFLMFKVQGFKFKGIVKITLKGDDTYTIEFMTIMKREVKHTREQVFFDEMVDIIDLYVEYTGADYEARVKEFFKQTIFG